MKFNVVWTPAAEQDLATVWTESRDRRAIPPLGVDYEVIEADHVVYVLAAWDSIRRA